MRVSADALLKCVLVLGRVGRRVKRGTFASEAIFEFESGERNGASKQQY